MVWFPLRVSKITSHFLCFFETVERWNVYLITKQTCLNSNCAEPSICTTENVFVLFFQLRNHFMHGYFERNVLWHLWCIGKRNNFIHCHQCNFHWIWNLIMYNELWIEIMIIQLLFKQLFSVIYISLIEFIVFWFQFWFEKVAFWCIFFVFWAGTFGCWIGSLISAIVCWSVTASCL